MQMGPVFGRERDRKASEKILGLLLEALTEANCIWLRSHPETPPLLSAGIRYRRESSPTPGAPIPEVWKTWPWLLRDKFGDCEDLACALASEYRVRRGIAARPMFTFRRKGNFSIYHIMVKLPDGRVLDPSRSLGMGSIV